MLTTLVVAAGCAGAQAQVPNPEEQVAQALVAAPSDKAEAARVMGYADDGSVVEIRAGTNDLTCLADNPADERFSASCYHESLEPYFARGRSLNAEGSPREDRYRIRFEEMSAGTLPSPVMSATQYIFDGAWDSASQTAEGSVRWVIYVPGATPESTGLSTQPVDGGPWIMFPGTPGAHIMIVPPRETGEG
ncbi:MAG: hypothetical protein ACR2QM_20275 [Longimicrobiales bacterium]